MSNSRVIQNEHGTWLAHWCGDPTTNPPIEEREWMCMRCFDKLCQLLSRPGFVDWDEVAKKAGEERLKHLFSLNGKIPIPQERIQQIEELNLKSEIVCKVCGVDLSRAAEALVEVY